ncbi:ABC transporter substrate-binding protein [Actinocorallia aurea]
MRIRPLGARPWSRTAVTTIATAALLATAACGGSGEGSSSAADTTLAFAIQGAPNSFDPAQLAEGQQTYVWNSLYDTLLFLDNDGTVKPNAAESWEYSEDGRALTLRLRAGMKFTSGAPVNAAAVKATLERTMKTPGQQQGKLASVSSIATPDDLTVVLALKAPDSSLVVSLAHGAGVIGDPATIDGDQTALNPVGSGPYTLDKAQTVTGSTYVLNRRDDYWNAKAYPFETVRIRVIQDRTAAFNALRAGELNAAVVDTPQVEASRQAGFEVKFVEATAIGNLVLADRGGDKLEPLGDARVRQAINMAFDRQKMVDQLLMGAGRPTVQLFNPKGTAYDASLEQTYAYDPAGAKKLLAEAGYPDGFSVTMPSLVFSKPFEPTITQALADIGVKATWKPVPPQNTVAALASKEYPMFFFVDGLSTEHREVQNNFSARGFLNPFASEDPALTKAMSGAGAELDPAKAGALFKEANSFTVKEAWDAPLFYIGTNWATKKGIEYLGDGSSTYNTVRAFGLFG